MTRDEHRNACIEAMKVKARDVMWDIYGIQLGVQQLDDVLNAAFDALHGIATVCALEATEGMIEAGDQVTEGDWDLDDVFDAMSAAGDLTNGPETLRRKSMTKP